MEASRSVLSRNQLVFAEVLTGFLIYVLVLGLFDDYTDWVSATSFSTIVFASVVLEALTFLTFLFKDWWIGWWTRRRGELPRAHKLLAMWPIMFFSKFVFLWALDWAFGSNFAVSGFVAIMIVIACVTVLAKLANAFFVRLGASADVLN
ncbi:MAG TPA: hypothetical protein VFP05_15605 [Thermomicrobiales bacterium]|nr:hypothetical protein [Thermomicrobiales bacterium]